MLYFSSAGFFSKLNFKKIVRNTIRVSNGFDPDQDRRSIGPGYKLFAKNISRRRQELPVNR